MIDAMEVNQNIIHVEQAGLKVNPVTFVLSDHERELLRTDLLDALTHGFDRRSPRYADAVVKSALPVDAIKGCIFASAQPFCVIRNLPVEQLPDNWSVGPADLSSAVLVGVTHAIGLHHFGYHEEKDGAILQDVHPIPGWESTMSNAGRIKFNLHVESPFLPRAARPEAAALLALNNDAGTATRIGVVAKINQLLPSHMINTLRQRLFTYRHDDSFKINGYALYTPPSPFLKTIDGFEESRCAIFTQAASSAGESAVAAWMEAAETVAVDLVLKAGDMLVFNNYRCIHGRGPVEGKRWLKRVYGSRDCPVSDELDLVSVWKAVGATDIDHSF